MKDFPQDLYINFIDEFLMISVPLVSDVISFAHLTTGCLACVIINEVWNDRPPSYCNDLIDTLLRLVVI